MYRAKLERVTTEPSDDPPPHVHWPHPTKIHFDEASRVLQLRMPSTALDDLAAAGETLHVEIVADDSVE
jgi:hypothetical protein